MIKFYCSQCDKKIGVPEDYAGKQVRCPKCKNAVSVPELEVEPESELEFIEPEPETELEFVEPEQDHSNTVLYDMPEHQEDIGQADGGYGVSRDGKYCTRCGKEVAEDANRCRSCGEQFETSESAHVASMEAERTHNRKNMCEHEGDELWYAGFWRRAIAIVLDVSVFYVAFRLFFPVYKYASAYFLKMLNDAGVIEVESWSEDKGMIVSGILIVTPVVLMFVMYFIRPECGTHQGTIGKRLLGIYVADMNGNAITFVKTFVRFIVGIISLIIPISLILPGFTYRKQGIHDVVTSSLVLSNNPTGCGSHSRKPRRGFFFWVGVVTSILVLIALAIIVFFVVTHDDKDDSKSKARDVRISSQSNRSSSSRRTSPRQKNYTPGKKRTGHSAQREPLFTLTTVSSFGLVDTFDRTKTYTIDGKKLDSFKTTGPMFIVDAKSSAFVRGDKRDFARKNLEQQAMSGIIKFKVSGEPQPITIDGMSGYVTSGTCKQFFTKDKMAVVHTVLFGEKKYYTMCGIVKEGQMGDYKDSFDQMAQSFKRKK